MTAPPPFSRFLEDHREAVYRFLLATVGPDEADDCFQETFIKALRAYPRLTSADNLRGWVLTIARRTAIDAARGRGRRPVPAPDLEPPAPDGTPEAADAGLWAAVRGLPPRQRAAVTLRYVNDLSYAEIGRVTGSFGGGGPPERLRGRPPATGGVEWMT